MSVRVHIVAITSDYPVLLEGSLTLDEYTLLKGMAGTMPSERQKEVTKESPVGSVLRKVYKYSLSERGYTGAYEECFSPSPSFQLSSEEGMTEQQGYTIVWYLTE